MFVGVETLLCRGLSAGHGFELQQSLGSCRNKECSKGSGWLRLAGWQGSGCLHVDWSSRCGSLRHRTLGVQKTNSQCNGLLRMYNISGRYPFDKKLIQLISKYPSYRWLWEGCGCRAKLASPWISRLLALWLTCRSASELSERNLALQGCAIDLSVA